MKLPNFDNKKDLFDYLVKNKQEIIDIKKSVVKHTDNIVLPFVSETTVNKALLTSHKDDEENGVITRTIVANTYNWLDSHGDVHIKGIFTKSIEERMEKIKHYHDHKHELTAKVGTPIDIYEKRVYWSDLGVKRIGYTDALFMDSQIKRVYNPVIYDMYKNNEIDQHSVGMVYVKMELAVNSDEYKEEMSAWNKYIDRIGNQEKAIEQGYFFAITEAKLIEVSAVPEGSNELTPTVTNTSKNITQEDEPLKDTQKDEPIIQVDYSKLLTKLKSN
jgi:hypothetical protein